MGFMVAMAAEDLRVLELTLRRLLVTAALYIMSSKKSLKVDNSSSIDTVLRF